MESRKQAICDALRAFIEQRPGFEFANYGDMTAYRSDQRTAQRQLHDARTLLRQVELSDGITADAMLAAADGRGRLSVEPLCYCGNCHSYVRDSLEACPNCGGMLHATGTPRYGIAWTTGQYWPMEFRAGVARYLASLLWYYKREHCMPAPMSTTGDRMYAGWEPGHKSPTAMSGGDWLRASFRREFGKGIAGRYFR